MKRMVSDLLKAWDQFFFQAPALLQLGVFRIIFALSTLVMYSIRLSDWRFYFTDEGFVQTASALEILPEFYQPIFSWVPQTPGMVLFWHVVFLFVLLFLAIGIFGRFMAAAALILHLAFLQRNFSIVYGADIVTTFFLFGLAFTENDRRVSVASWLRSRGQRAQKSMQSWSENLTAMGIRLIQIQLCIIYGYTGLEKLKGPSWWDGTAVWAVIGNQQLMMFDTSWLKNFPLVIAAMTLSTVVWEIYFPALVWLSGLRKWVLIFGLMLHAMIGVTVGLVFFSAAMASTYILFMKTETLERWLSFLRAPKRQPSA